MTDIIWLHSRDTDVVRTRLSESETSMDQGLGQEDEDTLVMHAEFQTRQ